jgi:hypothetical protein
LIDRHICNTDSIKQRVQDATADREQAFLDCLGNETSTLSALVSHPLYDQHLSKSILSFCRRSCLPIPKLTNESEIPLVVNKSIRKPTDISCLKEQISMSKKITPRVATVVFAGFVLAIGIFWNEALEGFP